MSIISFAIALSILKKNGLDVGDIVPAIAVCILIDFMLFMLAIGMLLG